MTKRRLIQLLAVVVVVAAGLLAVLLHDDGGSPAASETGPRILTAAELSDFASEAELPVYWLGPRPGAEYELSEASPDGTFLRYLTGGAKAGDESAFDTVATYAVEDGVAALKRARSERPGARLQRTGEGAVLLVDPSSPENAHFALPGANFQVEVYSPVPGQALRLVANGEVRPVPSGD